MSTDINYTFNISGNAAAVVNNITGGIDKMNTSVKQTSGIFQSLSAKFVVFNQASQTLQGFSNSLMNGAKAGLDFNSKMVRLIEDRR